ncbi:hypothetical protein D8674_008634 [Pyrus ussuriensis x Pyrus communis]|uniref:Uncharacterized protein n=1 Tax=Pyrus ussuriensis x Pyrus communis TaxID=2448454 RepID=A0A5N5HTC6_9ROSA|nr:hypothetical protein D8674_008634 [Pyrus ussuriensis x Pyrus communis]
MAKECYLHLDVKSKLHLESMLEWVVAATIEKTRGYVENLHLQSISSFGTSPHRTSERHHRISSSSSFPVSEISQSDLRGIASGPPQH